MQWQNLYSAERLSDRIRGKIPHPDTVRNSFHRDYDRIIFSSAFRRLQDKTQVFPLPGAVFVHNRLTHSLEVASVGRSLGKAVGEKIAALYPKLPEDFHTFYRYDLSNVIAAACLAHDIGNPPFGHSGEDAIRAYFKDGGAAIREILEDALPINQRMDFERFEGNSNAFRTLTHTFNETRSAYNLTITTLAAIVKYPATSEEGFNKQSGLIATRKSGFFDTEIPKFALIAERLGLIRQAGFQNVYARHPFVFLTEAADDICYRIIDLEDAHRLGITSLREMEELFLPFFEGQKDYFQRDRLVSGLADIHSANQKIQYLRAMWIGLMTRLLSDVFMEKETELLQGKVQHSLMELLPERERSLLKQIDEYAVKKVYNYRSVVAIEIAGFQVIGRLLEEFVQAALSPERLKSMKLLQLIPEQFVIGKGRENLYGNIQSVVDYIAGMTDLYAIDLFRKITGIEIAPI